MKRLRDYLNTLKREYHTFKGLLKEVPTKKKASYFFSALLITLLLGLPLALLIINLFIYIKWACILASLIAVLIFVLMLGQSYMYYSFIRFKQEKISIRAHILRNIILTLPILAIGLIIAFMLMGRFL